MLPSLRSKSGNVTETPTTAWVRPSSLSRFAHKLNAQSGCFLLRSTSTAALRCSTRRRLSRTPGAWSACVMSVAHLAAQAGAPGRREHSRNRVSGRPILRPDLGERSAVLPSPRLSSGSALACSTLARVSSTGEIFPASTRRVAAPAPRLATSADASANRMRSWATRTWKNAEVTCERISARL